MRLLALLLVTFLMACGPSASGTPVAPSPAAPCPVTTPPPVVLRPPPTFATGVNGGMVFQAGPGSFLYGNDTLVVDLATDGTLRPSDPSRGLRGGMKFAWWRLAPGGQLAITTRRLDGSTAPLAADVPSGYGETGFQVSGLYFASTGCWEVTGSVGVKSLSFVVRVVDR